MAELRVQLFGPYEVAIDGQPVSGFDSDKVRALLAYLAVEAARPHRRQKLAGLFWPDFPENSARTSLRRALSNLRQVIGDRDTEPPYLLITRQTIQFNNASQVWVDVARLSALYHRPGGQPPVITDLEAAVDLVRGPFLEGFSLPDSPPFEEWQRLTGESLQQQLLRTLHRLAGYYDGLEQYERALLFARRQVELEPYHEEGHQQVMRLLVQSGRRAEALAQFEILKETLAAELGVTPAAESVALYDRIQSGDVSPPPVERPQSVRGYELQELLGSGHFAAVYRAHQPVVGRDVAVKIIHPHFADDPNFIRRFAVEAQLVARLEHPHIVPLYDYWREPGGAFLVMRWLRGGSLEQTLQRGPWNLAPAVQLVQQVAAALQTAHRQGIIHRDIKPANILLDDAGNAYLSDFGVATLVGPLGALRQSLPVEADDTSGSLGYLSPESIQQEPLTAASDIYSLGVVVYELLTAQHPFPGYHGQELLDKHLHEPFPTLRLLRPELPPILDEVIQQATAKDPRERYADVLELAAALRGVVAVTPSPPPALVDMAAIQNPYKGLRPFQEADTADFFGRNALVERLLSRMKEDGPESRFLALVGPSGSGKSSVIAAGLLPALRRGALSGSNDWFIAQMIPGRYPLDELEIALLRVAVNQPVGLMEQLRRDERGLLRAASLALPDEGNELLLIIDQFEEVFTQASDLKESARFLQLLAAAVTEPHSQVRILISLRADFYDRPLIHLEFGRLMRFRTEVVVPMAAGEMSQAIYEPAARAGVQLESELMTAMVAGVSEQPGALPLLQYTLTELFERRDGQRLTLAAYHELGGVLGALARRAEGIYQSLDKTEQEMTRQLFLRLITLGEGVEDTRRRVLRSELEALQPAAETDTDNPPLSLVLDTFGRYRLLTFDRDEESRAPTVEVAHEALLREWGRLRSWLDESRDDIRRQRLLAEATAQWANAGQDPSYLLHGNRLTEFAAWAEMVGNGSGTVALTRQERLFLETSLAARERQRVEEQARQQRELETARRLAETERKRAEEQTEATQRLRRRAFFLVGALAIAAILAVVAIVNGNRAIQNANDARENLALAISREAEAVTNAQAAATQEALAQQNAGLAATREAEAQDNSFLAATRQVEAETQAFARATAETEALANAAEAQNVALVAGSQAALANNDTDTAITLAWQAVALNPGSGLAQAQLSEAAYALGTVRILSGNEALVNRVAVSPDGKTAVGGETEGALILWDMETGQVLWREQAFTPEELEETEEEIKLEVNDVAFSPDGQVIAATFDDRIMLWYTANGQLIRQINSTALDQKIAFSPKGDQFATIGKEEEGHLVFWDLASGTTIRELARGSIIEDFTYTTDGSTILLASQVGVLTLLDSQTGDIIYEVQEDLGTGAGGLRFVALSPDGNRVVTVFTNTGLLIWDLATGALLHHFSYQGGVFSVGFHPRDGTILTGGQGVLQAVNPQTGEVLHANTSQGAAIFDLAISSDGNYAVTTALDGIVRLWALQGGQIVRQYPAPHALLFQIALSPDARTVLVGSTNGSAILWDLETGEEIRRFVDDQPILAVAFSPDGSRVLTGAGYRLAQKVESGHIILWDVETGEEIRRLDGHPYAVFDVEFSPDGRLVASGGNGAIAILWDVETGKEIRRFEDYWEDYIYPDKSFWDVQFSPDGQQLFAFHSNGEIVGWNLEGDQQFPPLVGHTQGGHIVFNNNGQQLVSGSADSQVILWDMQTREIIRHFIGHSGGVGGVQFSPDETMLLGGGGEGTSSLWQIGTGEEIRRYKDGFVFSPLFTPDGRYAVVGYRDGRVALWRIDSTLDELLTWTQNNRYIPELTCEQRELYRIEPRCE